MVIGSERYCAGILLTSLFAAVSRSVSVVIILFAALYVLCNCCVYAVVDERQVIFRVVKFSARFQLFKDIYNFKAFET